MNKLTPLALVITLVACAACESEPQAQDHKDSDPPEAASKSEPTKGKEDMEENKGTEPKTELATFGAGCFWCVEAVLEQLPGVLDVTSGYMGGTTKNPTYEQVCSGATGHAEVAQVRFDPSKISYATILEWFWKLHDPTTLNKQGHDEGTQYRSAIFYHNEEQKQLAEKSRALLDESGTFGAPIVTEITKAGEFYKAEGYHQDYYRNNKSRPYCVYNILPKLDKLGLEK